MASRTSIALIISLLIAPTASGFTNYVESEPNGTKATATSIPPLLAGDTLQGFIQSSDTDYYFIQTAAQPAAIYRNRFVIQFFGSQAPTGTVRGLSQSGGVINPSSDIPVQSSIETTSPPRFNQWYSFGQATSLYYALQTANPNFQSYFVNYEQVQVSPQNVGVFRVASACGPLTISTYNQGHTTNTDIWIYDAQFNSIVNYGNDDVGPTTYESQLTRDFSPGRYYLALTTYDLANDRPAATDDPFQTGNALEFPGAALTSSPVVGLDLTFSITDADGPQQFPAFKNIAYEIVWISFDVVATPCNDSDPCTTDSAQGCQCVYTPMVCDDTDPCTTDTCVGGQCVYTPINCDDADPCTIDACVNGVCIHTPIDESELGPVVVTACDVCPGDVNGDEKINGLDAQGFTTCVLTGAPPPGGSLLAADADGSGLVTLADTGPFVAVLLANTACPTPPALAEPGPTQTPPAAPGVYPRGRSHIGPDAELRNVHAFSGEIYEAHTDLRIPGRGLDFVWSRKYRSRTGPISAMGNGWDFSYNIRVESLGVHRVLSDGDGRRDLYCLVAPDTWVRRELFHVLIRNPDGTYTVSFSDRGAWNLRALDGSFAAGRINTIVDRNNNTLTFAYDALGRLVTVTDTLGRAIAVGYNADGFISTVTDFIGRQIAYQYYQDSDAGGSFGDLKSVRTPVVTGTPNGNDFPSGKTTVYTYSKGFVDGRLNHNLLTITDPKGQTFLTNVYASTTVPGDVDFDHVVRQVWGGPGDIIDLVYVPQTPSGANNFAVVTVIVNDRVGNVREFSYDGRNRGVIDREYTGRAPDADSPTTESVNRPVSPLRPDDPAYFETRYEYNRDGLCTRVFYPSGNEERSAHDVCNADQRSRGNLLQHCRLRGPLLGDQTQICESWTYHATFNYPLTHSDGRDNVTQHGYDASGNCTQSTERIATVVTDYEYNAFGQRTACVWPDNGSAYRRRDQYTYYSSGPLTGYRQSEIVDVNTLALTTTYEYDAVGNLIRKIDPRGKDTLYTVNALNQVVREQSPEFIDGSGVRYRTDTSYDANDNVIRIDILNVDETGAIAPNADLTTTYAYDILNRRVSSTQEVDAGNDVVIEYQYDPNGNQTLLRNGEATNGTQPFNTVQSLYDERDLLFRVIRAPGSALQSTTQYDYDVNRNRKAAREGLEDNPRVTTYEFDGFDRLMKSTDALSNDTTYHFDGNSNLPSLRIDGELTDVAGGAGNVRLLEGFYTHDEMDRMRPEDVVLFDTQTQNPILDGDSVTETSYTDSSHERQVVDDNGRITTYTYDTALRKRTMIDAKNNTATYTYDANGNLTQTVEVDKSDIGGPDETFTTTYAYDNLNRLITVTDNAGNIQQHGYDSRHNRTVEIDPRGNTTRYVYDGLDRLVQSTRTLTDTGDGGGAPIGTIVLSQTWDDSSRLRTQIDDAGQTTEYVYDALNRRVATVFADGTMQVLTHDVHDNVLTIQDPNGTLVACQYDLRNRLTRRDITPGAGVSSDTTFEIYQYDGRSRLVRAEDNDSVVTFQHNSLSKVTQETQQIAAGPVRTIITRFDGENNLLQTLYPGGTRAILRSYDALDRVSVVRDPVAALATYFYVGPTRVARRDFNNGTRLDYSYDNVRRVTGTRHYRIAAGSNIDHRTYVWDAAGNKTSRNDLVAAENRLYGYDSANRLTRSEILVAGPIVTYTLNDVGNRVTVIGGSGAGAYSCDATTPDPADCQVNQYTATPFDARQYDFNGNLTVASSGPSGQQYTYDYRNRLVSAFNIATSQTTTYRYDCLGRRIEKNVAGTITRFYYQAWQEIEEQNAANATIATHVWGNEIDELLNSRRGATNYYFHADHLGSIAKVTSSANALLEQYRYADFGPPTILNPAGTPIAATAIGNNTLFTGRRFDPETGLYFYRTRYFDPRTGQFTSRDAIGIWGDLHNLGNGYSYLGNNPENGTDPMGLRRHGKFFKKFKKALQKYKKAVHDAPKKARKWTKARIKEVRHALKTMDEDLSHKLRRVWRAVYQGALRGALIGAIRGFIVGGPVGLLIGAAEGAIEGALTGLQYGVGEQFLGLSREHQDDIGMIHDLLRVLL